MLDDTLEEDDVVPISIAEWVIAEIEDDGIIFATPIYAQIFKMLI